MAVDSHRISPVVDPHTDELGLFNRPYYLVVKLSRLTGGEVFLVTSSQQHTYPHYDKIITDH